MSGNALQTFIDGMRTAWGPLTPELVAACRRRLESLLKASPSEAWLAELHSDRPASRELHRDRDHGFMLLAHTEHAGLYRPPHDHGRGWVIYALQRGEIEMRTYDRVGERLARRDSTLLRAGDVQAYLPGDIHDTRCVSDTALLLRFTERDLKVEDRTHHRVTRYVDEGGVWVPAAR